jgi:hypothetical protein
MAVSEISSEMRECIEQCLDCHKVCTEAASHVLHGDSKHSEGTHLAALLDCAQICLVNADFMARRSPHHAALVQACADICEACADLCEQHADKDGMMRRCAEICRECEQSCRQMAPAAVSGGQVNAGTALPQGTGAAAEPTAASAEGSNVEQGTGAGMTQGT